MGTIRSLLLLSIPTLSLASQYVLNLPNTPTTQQHTIQTDSETQIEHKLLQEILSLHTKPKVCASCQSVIAPLKSLALLGDDRFVKTLTTACKIRKLAEPEQCDGDISAQGPILAHDFRNIAVSGISAVRLCNALFGICEQPPVTPYQVDFPKPWPDQPEDGSEERREKYSKVLPERRERRPPFQVVHISDVHIDWEYTVGAEANCGKWICCRNFNDTQSDTDKNITAPAGPFGNFRCDTPTPLAHSMLDAIRELVPNAQFTISTGDIVDHANWLVTKETVSGSLHEFHNMLKKNLTNTFYGSLGNHDSYPTNAFAREGATADQNTDWVYELIGEDWKRWIGTEGVRAIRHHSGSYAVVHPGTDLKIISVNTQYWYKYNLWLYDTDDFIPDPNSILSFLVDELQAAEDAGQRAWIFGHVPPGVSDAMRDQSNYYNQIVHRYRDVIAGQFYGHTHYDSFQVAYANYWNRTEETAMNFGLIAPSLTPTNGNPAFTVYDVDPDTYDIMDRKVYIANLTDPHFQMKPKWYLLYSTRKTYAAFLQSESHPSSLAPPLTASFWHALTSHFLSNDTAFTEYRNRMVRNAWRVKCAGDRDRESEEYRKCVENVVCGLRAMRSEDNCDKPGGVVGWPPISAVHEHSCDGSMLPHIMKNLLG